MNPRSGELCAAFNRRAHPTRHEPRGRFRGALVILALSLLGTACTKTIPRSRYGVDTFEIEGMEQLEAEALSICLATRPRDDFRIELGRTGAPECGVAPFDAHRWILPMWSWPWTDWPLLDRSVFERDLARIERWLRARGYYEGTVESAELSPSEARDHDRFDPESPPCEEADEDEGCQVDIRVKVHEGDPVLVHAIDFAGVEDLTPKLQAKLKKVVDLDVGKRFDEALYESSRMDVLRALKKAGYAKARVEGHVEINVEGREAKILYTITSGPTCTFGQVRVEGAEDLSTRPLLGAVAFAEGEQYDERLLEETQRGVYALGVFTSVEVESTFPDDGSVAEIVIRVVPGRLFRYGVGAGFQAGLVQSGLTDSSVDSTREWDVHAVGFVETRNFLGGLRKLRLEEKPRLIFPGPFPAVQAELGSGRSMGPTFGNHVSLQFRQPAFIERQTSLNFEISHDYGPEAFLGSLRHEFSTAIGPERTYNKGTLLVSLQLKASLYANDPNLFETGEATPVDAASDYHVMLLEPYFRWDLRDSPTQPRVGAYLSLNAQLGGAFMPSSWDYVRVAPEARGYLPLPLGMVLAGRFALGFMYIWGSDFGRDSPSSQGALGPEQYRLRGGGANGNRGFIAGDLGDGSLGGTRKWEASIELRAPLTQSFGLVAFMDAGDVSKTLPDGTGRNAFNFAYPQVSVGFGLRYQTIVGPLRLDVGYRIPQLQHIGDPNLENDQRQRESPPAEALLFTQWPGAVHLTLGEAF